MTALHFGPSYILRRSEKQKKLKMILPIVRKVVYIYTKQGSGLKKSNLGHFPMRKWPTKWLLRLYKWKKNCSDYGVHGIQIERLGLTVPTQKSVLKNMHRVPRYYQKSVQNRPSKPNHRNLTHFGRYLGTRCIFFKTDFCVGTVSPSRSIWIPWTP